MSTSFLKLLFLSLILIQCAPKKEEMKHQYTNALIDETSPYLLQHAHNPVNWQAWHPEVLDKAKKENKPIIISIGYAACHWCHVMEEECFEDPEVAKLMNAEFINIKIDREERPDVDQIYMDALQMMTGSGGWPLNVIALPDGRPFWGATYLPKDNWLKALTELSTLFKENPDKVTSYAADLERGIKAINLVEVNQDTETLSAEALDGAITNWATYFDTFLGGYKRAPKFMMPNNIDLLLHYATDRNDKEIVDYVNTTLTRMAYGGVFDHVGGGFSRYSVDTKWHVPHFEKMLYDNGQLVSLYAKAYAVTKDPLYKKVVEETIEFIENELSDDSGGFYSSLDADSLNESGELEEGAFYIWSEQELKALLNSDFDIFKDYYNINSYGAWEGNYVLIRDKNDSEIAEKHQLSTNEVNSIIENSLTTLKKARQNRPRPRLDDKILTSWNGLMLKGLIDAYRYLQNDAYLELALNNAKFIENQMMQESGALYRNHKNGRSNINGFLEDYASTIEAFIALYEATFDEKWLLHSKLLTDYALAHFKDEKSGMLYFTSDMDDSLIRRTIEVNDNVISASNSIMATNLLKLHKVFNKEGYGAMAHQMLKNVQDNFAENGQSFANWMHLALFEQQNFYEIAVVGDDYKEVGDQLAKYYIPNSILLGTRKEGGVELLKGRHNEGQTLIYVCIEGSCKLPVQSPEKAVQQM